LSRELKRQIHGLYYDRSGPSTYKDSLSEFTYSLSETTNPEQIIGDPYIFEFPGLTSREVMSKSPLEDQLLDKLQEFLLELSHGFCFEGRQKWILIGDTSTMWILFFSSDVEMSCAG